MLKCELLEVLNKKKRPLLLLESLCGGCFKGVENIGVEPITF